VIEELKDKRASQVFLDYVEPYLENYIQNNSKPVSPENIKKLLVISWCVWNAMVLKNFSEAKFDYWELLLEKVEGYPKMMDLVESMKERKIHFFHEYQYLLGDFEVFFEHNTQKITLTLEAKDPSSLFLTVH
jgi:hypothetical protein